MIKINIIRKYKLSGITIYIFIIKTLGTPPPPTQMHTHALVHTSILKIKFGDD